MLPRAPFRIATVLTVGIAILGGVGLGQPPNGLRGAGLPTDSVYLYGKVILDDGTSAPDSVAIERVCNGAVRREAYTDSKGRFSFEIGRKAPALQDSTANSTTDAATGPVGTGGLVATSNAGLNSVAGGLGRLADCELRAVLSGSTR